MGDRIELNIEPKYYQGDRVRVVTTDTPFFGWTGQLVGSAERFELTKTHYFVQMDEWGEDSAALLFSEMQLCLLAESEDRQ